MSGKENSGTGDKDSALQSADTLRAQAAAIGAQDEAMRSGRAPHWWVGLLDGQGRLVSVNICQRSADLNPPSDVVGRGLHGWLHPGCVLQECPLAASLAECWAALLRDAVCEAQLRENLTNRMLHLSAWRMRPVGVATRSVGDSLAVVVVTVVTGTTAIDQTGRELDREFELRLLRRTEALVHEIQNLQSELVCCQAAEEHTRSSHAELAAAARRLMSIQELERVWVARQLRESVIQTLGAVKYRLEARDGSSRSAVSQLQEAMGDIDAIATSVRPSILDDFGAVSAVNWLCREFALSHATLQVRETISVRDDAIPKRLQTAVFRSVQELLSNVATHAQTHGVTVCLSQVSGQLILEVLEDGFSSGWTGGEVTSRSDQGIFSARMHAELSGGHFSSAARDGGAGRGARIQWALAPGEIKTGSP
jgi:signal transduction histidine kinase